MRARSHGFAAALTAAAASAALLAGSLGAGAARAEDGGPVPAGPAPAILAPVDVTAESGPAPTAAGVSAAIRPLVRKGLRDASIVVLDPATGTTLFEQAADRGQMPASTVKIATSAAALHVLGQQARIPTITYRQGTTVYLVGGGDPTLVRKAGGNPLAGGSSSLKELAHATAAGFDAQTPIRLVYDATAFRGPTLGPGWPTSFPGAGVAAPVTALVVDGGRVRPGATSRVQDPAKQAASAFAGFLRGQGLDVTSVEAGTRDEAATEVARVESPPIVDIVQRMLTASENNYAEALAHLTGAKLLGQPTFAGGAKATEQTLESLGIDTAGLALVDGSGLSRRDRMRAQLLADVLVDVVQAKDADLAAIAPGLAVAGFTGTLADRFATAATAAGRGVVHAKTGTLTGVVSLAGTVLDAEGRVLVFALIANKVASLAGARDTMDQLASRLATCGCT